MRHFVLVLAVIALAGAELSAQIERNTPPPSDTVRYRGLAWRNIGPNRGGRSIAVAGSVARPNEYYFGATGGGLWKTTDAGTTWQPVTDGKIGSSSIGAVEVCQRNPDVLYLGTGETQLRGNILPGDGVYKSTDAGKTWTHIGFREGRNIARVRVHPTDCNTAYVAVFGQYSDPNPERGIYKTRDGGRTWQRVLHRNTQTGGVDISIDPRNPNVVYAALWEAWRKQWGMSSGGPGSGLFRSTDGGRSWTELTRRPGMPQQGLVGKIGVSVSPADPRRVYAIVEHDSGGVFRSDDRGNTWTRMNQERKLRQRAFYYTRINADPQQRDRVYVLNVGFHRSDDGGKTFPTTIRVPHSDNHDLWIAPNNNQRMINGNDGGGNVSVNGGQSWTDQDYPTAQIYRLALTSHQPAFACGGQQDNTTVCVPVRGWSHMAARGGGNYFFAAGGCESGYVAPHPVNTNLYFAGCYGGSLDRFDQETGQVRPVNVWPENPMGQSAADLRERVQWTFPIVFDPFDPNTLYTGTQHVWKSTNQGASWQRISRDLTRADPQTLGPSGGPITRDQTGVETYGTVFTIAPSPRQRGLVWTGSDDGYVYLTRNGGGNWQNVTPQVLPVHTKLFTVEASPHRPGTAYIAGNRYLLGDFRPYLFRTDDFGRSWTDIGRGIPEGDFLRSVREDPVRRGMLYAATERGIWISWDNGLSWESLRLNLPVVQVSDVAVTENDVVIATHGRSFYVLDYGAHLLRQMNELPARTAEVPRGPASDEGMQSTIRLFRPANPTRGVDPAVTVYYSLDRPAQKLALEFLDPQGKLIRSFAARAPGDTTRQRSGAAGGGEEEDFGPRQPREAPNRTGMNRFTWNLRHPGPTGFPGMILWAADTALGPMALPGNYTVRLVADGQRFTQPFAIRLDPRVKGIAETDLRKRFDFAMQIRNRTSEANEAVLLVRGVKQQLDQRLAGTQDAELRRALEDTRSRLNAVEERIYQVRLQSNQDPLNYPIRLNNKLAALLGHVERAESAPTAQSYEVFRELSAQLDRELAAINAVLAQNLEPLNQRLRARGMQPVTRTPLQTAAAAAR